VDSSGIYFFGNPGRIYGVLLLGICGRNFICCATTRGFLYRYGFRLFTAIPGYIDTTFSLRRHMGGLYHYCDKWQKDECFPLKYWSHKWVDNGYRVSGSLHHHGSGLVGLVLVGMHREAFPPIASKNPEIFAKHSMEDDGFYLSDSKKWD